MGKRPERSKTKDRDWPLQGPWKDSQAWYLQTSSEVREVDGFEKHLEGETCCPRQAKDKKCRVAPKAFFQTDQDSNQ